MTPSFKTDILGIPPSTANTSDSTLIIIDAQNEYAQGKLKVSNATTSRQKIKELLEKYRKNNGHVIHVKHSVPDGAPVFTPGTQLAQEFDELTPKDGEKVIMKKFPGSFAETPLKQELDGLGAKKVVLVGYMVCSLLLSGFECVGASFGSVFWRKLNRIS
jgi:nicotinamidase-related amidase